MNIIDEAGILAIATRLQRLSDNIRKDGMAIYKSFAIDFEPKWFPVIYTLYKRKSMNVVELANEIGYSHPSTIILLKELEKNKLIKSKKDKADERKRILTLSTKGNDLVEKLQPIWQLFIKAMSEAINTENNLMKAIAEVETELEKESFIQRVTRLQAQK
ncbi:MarR family winged helix-turn-helix transcriptional regulator [Flavobacterium sp.]|uniref:MarR family winged helix-turn-helix transcriptional regulator n=1 Tax=Flavobacterium sp. TaxID=239 RepID=UPI00374DDCB2